MPVRRRIIQGGYIWECNFIQSSLVVEDGARIRFPVLYRAYVDYSEERRWRPVVPHVFASILRREALKMPGVRAVGERWVTWKGLRLRLSTER